MKTTSKKSHAALAAAWLAFAALAAAPDSRAALRLFGGQAALSATAQVSLIEGLEARQGGQGDTTYTFVPTIDYVRDRSRLKLRGNLSMPVTRYSSVREYDSEDTIFTFSGNLPYASGPRLSGGWNVRFFEGVQSDYFLNTQLKRKTFNVGGNAKYRLMRRMSLRTSASYNDTDSESVFGESFSNTQTTTYAVGLERSEVFKDIAIYADYRTRKRESAGVQGSSIDDTDQSIVFGVNGQILPERLFPKLEADLSFGIATTDELSEGGERRNRFTLDGGLSYPATQKTRLSLNFSRGLSVTADDQTVESSNLEFSVQSSPLRSVSLSARVGYTIHEFLSGETAREDKVISTGVDASYAMRRWWRFNVAYTLRSSDSNQRISDFDQSVISASTTFTY